jgi:hypothetical protein
MAENEDRQDENQGRELTEAELEQRQQAARKHGVRSYEMTGKLPAEMEGFDVKLAQELLEETQDPGNVGFQILAKSAARRATLLELAYSFLAREDVPAFWLEKKGGREILRWQPILERLASYHEGLRRDLQELGLTPAARVRLDLGMKQLSLDDLLGRPIDEGNDNE